MLGARGRLALRLKGSLASAYGSRFRDLFYVSPGETRRLRAEAE